MFENNRRRNNGRVVSVVLYLLGIVLLIGLDQLVKYWAVTSLKPKGSINVIGDAIRFTYAQNTGAAFSILQNKMLLLTILPAALSLVFIILIIMGTMKSVLGNISLMLIAAGGIGNLIDRVYRGFVVDFIDFHFINFAIFNVADSCVTIGVILFIIYIIFHESNSERRRPKNGIFTRRRF